VIGLALELGRLPSELRQILSPRELVEIIAFKELQLDKAKGGGKRHMSEDEAELFLQAIGAVAA
jgi:hypothetical protein